MKQIPASLVLACIAALSACDSVPQDGDPPGVVQDPIPYDAQRIAAGLSLPEALAEQVKVVYTDSVRVTYAFETNDQFDQAAEALLRTSAASSRALLLPTRFRGLNVSTQFALPQEMALADDRGRVVIGDRVYRLTGRPDAPVAVVTSREGELIEEIVPGTEEPPTDGARRTTTAECIDLGTRRDAFDTTWYLVGTYKNVAFRSWTRLRMIAESEIRAATNVGSLSRCDLYPVLPASRFPNAFVSARVVGFDEGQCVAATASFNAALQPSAGRVYVEVRRPRAPDTGVEYSEHVFSLDGPFGGTSRFLYGTGNRNCTI